ncbi:MAG: DUF3854 domain-containing protein [Gemmataceae bacterium]|nr:DUF3854 domain-containing protein [Gemmataceae bacterium]
MANSEQTQAKHVTVLAHEADLIASGITRDAWEAAGLYTEEDPKRVSDLLAWPYSAKKLGPCLCFPYFDIDGKPLDYVRVKPRTPRRNKEGKTVKYEAPRGKPPHIYFPPIVRETHSTAAFFILTEGEKKALAGCLQGLPVIGLSGVWSWKSKDTPILPELAAIIRKGITIYICFDSDRATNEKIRVAENHLAAALKDLGAVVRVAGLPSGPDGAKVGLDDYFVAGATADDFRADILGTATEPRDPNAGKPKPKNGREVIILGTDEFRVNDEAIVALTKDKDTYARTGQLARVILPGDELPSGKTLEEGSRIIPTSAATLRERLTRVADFYTARAGDFGTEYFCSNPPQSMVLAILDRGEWSGIRPLVGVTSSPILRTDGSIYSTHGYDAATGLYLVSNGVEFPPLEKLTRDSAQKAAGTILDLIRDFPVADEAGRSVYLSMILSVICRHLIDGSVPLHLADANVRGSGKSMYIDSGSIISTGTTAPAQAYSSETAEMRKIITSVVMAGNQLQNLDNLPSGGAFGNSALDMALTCRIWEDRILSTNKKLIAPHRTVWTATGNNPVLRADTARRVIRTRLESDHEHPEDRDGFKYPDLLAHIRRNRPQLVINALSIVAAYLKAGTPSVALKPAGGFVEWSNVVRAPLVWLGLADPWDTNITGREDLDNEASELHSLLTAWEEIGGTAGVSVAKAKRAYIANPDRYPAVADLLVAVGLDGFDSSKVGYLIRKHKGRPGPGKRMLALAKEEHGHEKVWVVQRKSDAGHGGDVGHDSATATFEFDEEKKTTHKTEAALASKHDPHAPHDPQEEAPDPNPSGWTYSRADLGGIM